MRRLTALFCLFLLSGCISNVQRLDRINPPANDFASALASEYQAYANSESEQGRKLAAEYYAGKGLKALRGEPVPPEKPRQDRGELMTAYKRLQALLTDDMKHVAAQKLARAQLMYDCWQYQHAHGLAQEKAPCAEEFRAGVSELEEVADSFLYDEARHEEILFAPGSDKLTTRARVFLREVVHEVADKERVAIEVVAHHTGQDSKDMSTARLQAVRLALIRGGVAEKHIQLKKEDDTKKVVLSGSLIDDDNDKNNTVDMMVKTHTAANTGESSR